MAELSLEETQRLARGFLTGKCTSAEAEDLKRAIESDSQAALELLQQMQSALEDVPPSGFSPEQWKELEGRVFTLIGGQAKSGFGFLGRLFSKLFKKRSPAPAPAPKPKAPEAAPAPRPAAPVEAEEGMEEMAPIMAPSAAVREEPQPEPEPVEEARPRARSSSRGSSGSLAKWALAALVLGVGIWAFLSLNVLGRVAAKARSWASPKAAPTPQLQATPAPVPPTPTPQPTPTPREQAYRALPPVEPGDPLPALLPQMTPRDAGERAEPIKGLEAKEEEGGRGLPLPAP